MLYGGASYKVICTLAFILAIIGIHRVWRGARDKAETLISVLLVGLFFGLTWEPEGTGLVWSYLGFRIYTYMDIPLLMFLNWAWWMILCYMIAERIMGIFNRTLGNKNYWLMSTIAFFISGTLVALIIEPLSVSLGLWKYLVIGEKAVLAFPFIGVRFNLTVIIGWGMLTVINLSFSTKAAKPLAIKVMRKLRLSYMRALTVSCALLGLFSGWLSWQLVGFFAALIEAPSESPILFFTKNYVVKLEWITSAQLVTVLLIASTCVAYLWKIRGDQN